LGSTTWRGPVKGGGGGQRVEILCIEKRTDVNSPKRQEDGTKISHEQNMGLTEEDKRARHPFQ